VSVTVRYFLLSKIGCLRISIRVSLLVRLGVCDGLRVTMYGAENFETIALIYEFMEHDLCGLIYDGRIANEACVKFLMKQLLRGLNHCQAKKVVHRDLKRALLPPAFA
jgi:serine/threonine protein kinase